VPGDVSGKPAARGKLAWIAAAVLANAACSTLNADETPAVILDPSPESRAELARAVSEALHGAPVTLADDALTRTSLLVIERPGPRDLEQRPLTGRVLDPPEQFRLVLRGSRCVLVHLATGEGRVLGATTCRPE
jgi:hypothetical protein